MSTAGSSSSKRRSAEERAEELMARVTADASRFLTRFAARAREELEDLVAEARSVKNERWDNQGQRGAGGRSSGSSAGRSGRG
jgi:vacuolar-type H+-ATPase subunit H